MVVIEGDAGEDVPRIELDNGEAAAQIASHLRALGHRRVAVVTLPFDGRARRGDATPDRIADITTPVTRVRLDSTLAVFPDARVVSAGASLIDEGLLAGRLLFADPARRPTAVIAQSDLLAAGVIRAAEEAGLRVPQDVSVAGFDGIAVDGLGEHVLTTAVQPAVREGPGRGRRDRAHAGGGAGRVDPVHLHVPRGHDDRSRAGRPGSARPTGSRAR